MRLAATAPMLTNVVLALPRNGFGGVVDVVELEPEVELLQVLLTSSKLAQASRLRRSRISITHSGQKMELQEGSRHLKGPSAPETCLTTPFR